MLSGNPNENNFSLKARIAGFEGEKVKLILEDNQVLFWPKSKLPENITENNEFDLWAGEGKSSANEENFAKILLNQIFNNKKNELKS